MDVTESASDKGLSGKGATPGSDCLTPQRRHSNGNGNDTAMASSVLADVPIALVGGGCDISVRRSALMRTPVKQAVNRWEQHCLQDPGPGGVDNPSNESVKGKLSPDLEFLRSLTETTRDTTKLTGTETSEKDDVILIADTPGSKSDNSPEDLFHMKKKRKRNSGFSPEQDKLMHEIQPSANIALLHKQVLELIDFGSRNQNVHKHIKSLARKLRDTAEKVTLDYKRTEFTKKENERDVLRREQHLQERIEQLEELGKTKAEENTVVETICPTCKTQTAVVSTLVGIDPIDLKSFRQMTSRPWQKTTFRRTKLLSRSGIGKIPDHVVILSDRLYDGKEESQTKAANKMEKEVLTQFPELEKEAPTECLGGYNICLEEVTSSKIKGTSRNTVKSRSVSVMFRHDDAGDNLEKTHGQLLEVKKTLIEAEIKEITLVAPTYIDSNVLQKLCECVFVDTNISVQIAVEKAAKAVEKAVSGSYAKAARGKVRRDRGEALIVEASEDKGYDNLLGELRNKLSPNAAASITRVKKTTNGNLLLSIRGEAEANQLRNTVSEILTTNKIRVADGLTKKTLFVKGIDSMASNEEIKETLLTICKLEHQEQFKMSVNKNVHGEQTAVVTMVTADAEKMLSLRTVRIGFSDCYIQERIKVDRCYRCWQFGHNARACSNQDTDMSNHCYKCGQAGHHKAKCTSETDFCPTCKMEGHQSGTGACRSFRTALGKELKRRRASIVNAAPRAT